MRILHICGVICLSAILCGCGEKTDPTVAGASQTYYLQALTVTKTPAFVAGLSGFGGGTPDQLAADFADQVYKEAATNLPPKMHGKLPAKVVVQLNAVNYNDSYYTASSQSADGTVSIVDAASGKTVAAYNVHADNKAQQQQYYSTTAGALGTVIGTVILKAVVPAKNLGLWSMARELSRDACDKMRS